MRAITLLFISLTLLVAGCATQDSVNTQAGLQKRMLELTKKDNAKNALVVVVPSADNALSDAMMLAGLKSGTETNAVRNISGLLQGQKATSIAVMGDNDAITAETLRQAMKKQEGKAVSASVFFVGDPSHAPELKAQAEQLGIRFEAVAYPPRNK